MADIRLNPEIKDDFNRADENPVALPWKRETTGADMEVRSSRLGGTAFPPTSSHAYWSSETWSGDAIEVWGIIGFSGPPVASGFRFGVILSGSDFIGYECLMSNGIPDDTWTIRRYDAGAGVFTTIAQEVTGLPNPNDLALMQLIGSDVNCYVSTDAGDNWTLKVTASDNNYRTDLYGFLGTTGTEVDWNAFGGGTELELSQIYRRPNE